MRSLNWDGKGGVLLSGLGRFRFKVHATSILSQGNHIERELEIDGHSVAELQLDLR